MTCRSLRWTSREVGLPERRREAPLRTDGGGVRRFPRARGPPHRPPSRLPEVIGLIMAFGAGVLISSVAFELVDDAAQVGTFGATAAGLAAGSLTFFVGDVLIARAGAKNRKRSTQPRTDAASGSALALGALLDGIPESAAIGVTILQGGSPSMAFIAAVA